MNEGMGMLQAGAIELQQEFIPPHMVQIPLEEYRRYIEATIKGSTEIPLEEYNRLRMDAERLRYNTEMLQNENENLRAEIDRRTDIKTLLTQETGRIAEELKMILLQVNLVPDSVTRNSEKKEREVARNGRI